MLAEHDHHNPFGILEGYESTEETARRRNLLDLFEQCPIPGQELLCNLFLYSNKAEMARLLCLHEMYRQILSVPGVIMEFGVRWGQNLALFESFRGIYEPFNRSRKIIGFDTFQGFPSVSAEDASTSPGDYSVTPNYEEHLERVLAAREGEGAVTHIKKFELVKGDACVTVKEYLDRRPETIVSLAYFDLDLYKPTRAVLEMIQPFLTRGSVIAFDELRSEHFPGETVALREVVGLDKVRLVHTPYSSHRAYFICQ